MNRFRCGPYHKFKGNPGPSRAVFIVRSNIGDFIWGGSIKLLDCSNNDAGYVELLGGLRMCKDQNLRSIDIEGDSLNVIQIVAFGDTPSWKSRMWVNGIWEMLEGMDFSLKHIFREAIKDADFLSNYAIDQDIEAIISDDVMT
ncbi:hypothetical protein SUGI_0981310 [Cryptomeria japonica]|nr:hypothetical protein SUGI_0981310 [Cryptomeria japonica]